MPCTGGRSRGDPGWQTCPRSRSGPWTGRGQLRARQDAKSGLGRGGHGGDAGAPEVAPRRTEVPGPHRAWGRPVGTPLLRPGPHLSGRPPRTLIREGGSRLGRGACARPPRTFAPPPLAAGRGRGRGRVRAGPGGRRTAPPGLHGNERRPSGYQPLAHPQPSGAEPTEHLPASHKLTRSQQWEAEASQPGRPQRKARLGSKEALAGVERLKRLGKFSTAVSAPGMYLYHPSSCHFLSLKLPERPGNSARQGHLSPFYN